jgi:hypothetical protein
VTSRLAVSDFRKFLSTLTLVDSPEVVVVTDRRRRRKEVGTAVSTFAEKLS